MKQQISLRNEFIPKTCPDLPFEVVEQAITNEESLEEKEDYFYVGSDMHIRLKAALWVIGRFAITNINPIVNDIVRLSQPEKKVWSGNNDTRLPQLNETEQDWNDKIIPIIKTNAKILQMEFKRFLGEVYKEMDVNFYTYIGDYLESVNLPGASITKFRVVTCTKELRILFEDAMNQVMENARYRRTG